jgi:7,8-dihydropterin-6-yl-methyl-4-(beta-D-ribofuranosyl)aminobenzene 5'-phosphate synthase
MIKENVSVSSEVFDAYSDRFCFINDFARIEENIFLVSKFKHKHLLVKSNKNLLVKIDGKFQKDEFDHEVALVIHNAGKLVIITGCSHNGAENMIDTIKGYFPEMPVQTIIGGFHLMGFPFSNLMGESRGNITTLGERLLNYEIEKTYTCHCTGKRGYNILKETMGDRIDYFYTGMQVEI